MVTASPPVSPSVVARILMIQNASVTSGTLATSPDLLAILSAQNHRRLPGPAGTCGSVLLITGNRLRLPCACAVLLLRAAPAPCVQESADRYRSTSRRRARPSGLRCAIL